MLYENVLLHKDTAIFNSEKDFYSFWNFILDDEPNFVRKKAIAFYNLISRTIISFDFLFLQIFHSSGVVFCIRTLLFPFSFFLITNDFFLILFRPDLSVSVNNPFVAGKFFKCHWSTGMKLLGGDTDFSTQSKLSAISKSGRNVAVNSSCID